MRLSKAMMVIYFLVGTTSHPTSYTTPSQTRTFTTIKGLLTISQQHRVGAEPMMLSPSNTDINNRWLRVGVKALEQLIDQVFGEFATVTRYWHWQLDADFVAVFRVNQQPVTAIDRLKVQHNLR